VSILLIDVDSKIPNIALGRVSTYYKSLGVPVSYKHLGLDGYPRKSSTRITVDATGFSEVFVSNIFTVNQGAFEVRGCDTVHVGGVGSVNMMATLSKDIDASEVDYTLWQDNKTSYGFITRGCNRKCSFCFVPKTEGLLRFAGGIDSIVRHKKVSFLDNNILAYEDAPYTLIELWMRGIRCEFSQGLDIRLVDDTLAELLAKLSYIGAYTFAFDHVKYIKLIERKTAILKKHISRDWGMRFFVYQNAETYSISDLLTRIDWCINNKCLPYVMRDNNCWTSEHSDFYVDIAAYCNQPSILKKMTFEEFLHKRHKKQERIRKSLLTYVTNK